jgi:SAM-dependent methyltransferase
VKRCLDCQHEFDSASWACPECGFQPERSGDFMQFAPDLDETDSGFDPASFEKLFRVESGNFWFRSRNRLITWAIKKYFPEVKSFLEIGCGTGFVLTAIRQHFPHVECTGSEIHSAGLKFAQSRLSDTSLCQMDARNIPFTEEFDLVGAFDVLEHIEEDEQVLGQLFDAVKPGGGILLTVPQHPFLWSSADEAACHHRRYTRRELKAKVIDAGFEVIRTSSFVTFLLPLMAVSRLVAKSPKQGQREFELPGALNSLFEVTMNVESALIRAGINLPAGGSLLMSARKPG